MAHSKLVSSLHMAAAPCIVRQVLGVSMHVFNDVSLPGVDGEDKTIILITTDHLSNFEHQPLTALGIITAELIVHVVMGKRATVAHKRQLLALACTPRLADRAKNLTSDTIDGLFDAFHEELSDVDRAWVDANMEGCGSDKLQTVKEFHRHDRGECC